MNLNHKRSTDLQRLSSTPRTLVCPGVLSRKINRKSSTSQSARLQAKISNKLLRDRISKADTTTTSQPDSVTSKSALVVTPTQGIYQIHLKHFDLSDTGIKRIENTFQSEFPADLRLSWKFLLFERTTIPLNSPTNNRYDIDSSVLYKVDINENFFEYVLNRELSLELYAGSKDKEVFLARGMLKIADCLEYPTNDLYAYVEFCDADKALVLSHTGISVVYGTLSLYYRLNCDVEILTALLRRTTTHIYYSPSIIETKKASKDFNNKSDSISRDQRTSRISQLTFQVPNDISDDSDTINSLEPTNSEIESFRDALNLVLSRNKALKTTQSEIDRELNERTTWLHEESCWKRTLQEHAILCGNDPYKIEWRQWRDNDTAMIKNRRYTSGITACDPEIEITIEYFKPYKSNPIVKQKYKNVHVEYSFLGHDGIEMQSPVVPFSTDGKTYFNFTKTFRVDVEKNSTVAQKLAEAVKNREDIKFILVGERNDGDVGIPCCEEVSSCVMNMMELIEADTNVIVESLPLLDVTDQDVEIGYLKVKVSGVQAMRRIALKILAPSGFIVP